MERKAGVASAVYKLQAAILGFAYKPPLSRSQLGSKPKATFPIIAIA